MRTRFWLWGLAVLGAGCGAPALEDPATPEREAATGRAAGLTICAEKPAGWGGVTLHSWSAQPSGSLADTAWPGAEMPQADGAWHCLSFPGVSALNLVLSDHGAPQTGDLFRDRDGCYSIGSASWVDTCPPLQAPVDSDGDGVTDDLDHCPGTPAGAAVDAVGCPVGAGLTICAEKPAGWLSVYAHSWGALPAGSQADTAWPGAAMTAAGGAWYCLSYPGVSALNLVFDNNGAPQSADLFRDRDGCYVIETATWLDTCPPLGAPPADSDGDGVTDDVDQCPGTPAGAAVDGVGCPLPVTARTICAEKPAGWASVYLHAWNATPTGSLANTAWPGVAMTPWGGAWYCATFPGVSTLNLVLNDQGAPQTGNLSRDRDGCYLIGTSTWVDTCEPLGGTPPPPPVDSDGDGVTDDLDQCPGTPAGSVVDAAGCPLPGPSGADFREESIYFVITTRFFNGDPTNDYYNRDRYRAGDPHWRGDFAGLIQQLDYIRGLGFTALWITPPVENRSGLDYHGYHAYDWTKVDPRLESPGATYQELIDAAHARGMKIIQDVVINHSSNYGIRGQVWIDHLPIKYFVPQGSLQGLINNGPYQGNLGDYASPFRDDNDNPLAPAWFRARHGSDAAGTTPLVDPKTGQTVPSPGYDASRFFGVDVNGLDPSWYHQDGFIAGGDWESPLPLVTKHIAGDAIDLATERANVRAYLNQAVHRYLDMGVDAIRLDTAKHLERGDLLSYVNDWRAHKPGLFVFGEVLVKGTGLGSELANDNASAVIRPWWYTRTGTNPGDPSSGGDSGFSVLDFSLFSTFRDNVTRGDFSQIGGMLGWDWIYGDATKLVTFFQNHDVGPDNDFKYRFGGQAWQAAIAYNLLWTIRGIPTLYYGEEIQFMGGAPQDIEGPNDTLDQTGRAYFGDHLLPQNLATTQAHPLFRHIQRLNMIRRAIPALQKAPMSHVNEFGGGISFVRNLNGGQSVAVVGLAAGGDVSFNVGGIPNGTYRDCVTGGTITVSGGSIGFSVQAHSAGIWVLNGPGKIGQDGVFLR